MAVPDEEVAESVQEARSGFSLNFPEVPPVPQKQENRRGQNSLHSKGWGGRGAGRDTSVPTHTESESRQPPDPTRKGTAQAADQEMFGTNQDCGTAWEEWAQVTALSHQKPRLQHSLRRTGLL